MPIAAFSLSAQAPDEAAPPSETYTQEQKRKVDRA